MESFKLCKKRNSLAPTYARVRENKTEFFFSFLFSSIIDEDENCRFYPDYDDDDDLVIPDGIDICGKVKFGKW